MTPAVALRLGRISNLPTVWTNVLTGVVLAGGLGAWGPTAAALTALSLLYVAGMYLNDAFDRDFDRRARRERPIPAGEVSVTTVFAAGFGMMALALLVLAAAGYLLEAGTGWRAPAAGLALAAAIVAYDRHHKDNPWSPLLMGICRMLVYVTAALGVAPHLPREVLLAAAVLLCYLIGLTYVAKQETLGRVASWWPLGFLLVPAVYLLPAPAAGLTGVVFYALFLAWTGYSLSFVVRREKDVPRTVVSLIAGICLLDALLIAAQGYTAPAWIAAAGLPLTALLQRVVPGT